MKTVTQEAIIARIKFYFLTICVLNNILLIQGKRNLEIFKNVSGDVTKVTSNVIEIPSGLNVTLLCKFVLWKKEKMTKIYWFKTPTSYKSALKVTIDLENGATLRLDNFSLKDEGHYICVNSKYGFFQSIYLFVTNGNIKNSSAISNSMKSHLNELDYKIIPANITINDFDTNPQQTSNLSSIKENVVLFHFYLDVVVQRGKDIEQHRKDSKSTHLHPISIVIGCIIGVCVSLYELFYGRGRTLWNFIRTSNSTQSTPSAPSATIDLSDVSSTIIHENTLQGDLDLPPNYNTFVHNTRVDSEESILPPNYHEAVARENCPNNGHTSDHET